jgi:hypothetical protein
MRIFEIKSKARTRYLKSRGKQGRVESRIESKDTGKQEAGRVGPTTRRRGQSAAPCRRVRGAPHTCPQQYRQQLRRNAPMRNTESQHMKRGAPWEQACSPTWRSKCRGRAIPAKTKETVLEESSRRPLPAAQITCQAEHACCDGESPVETRAMALTLSTAAKGPARILPQNRHKWIQ